MTSVTPRSFQRIAAIVAVILIGLCAWYPPIQQLADAQVDAGLKRALISFASARTLNAVISVIQGTEFSVQPMGVGVTLTLGQVLDPINDLVEQFSNIMLVASVAFGVQKALLAISGHWLASALVSGFALAWAVLYYLQKAPDWLSRAVLVLLMIRFVIPVVTLGSDLIFQQLMAKDYEQSQAALDLATAEARKSTPKAPIAFESKGEAPPQSGPAPGKGWWPWPKDPEAGPTKDPEVGDDKSVIEEIKEKLGGILPKVPDFEKTKQAVEQVPERVIKLIVIFLAQTIIVPLILLWALYKVALGVVRPSPPAG